MRTLFTLGILIISAVLHGQKDEAAEPYLDKVSKELSAEKAVAIDFDYIREDLQSETKIEGNGSLVLLGEKYKMDLTEAIIFFDGKKQYSLNIEVEEVYISVPDPKDKNFMFSDPIQLLRNYKEKFKYRLMGETTILNKAADEIQLYPEELGGPYALIKLFFSRDKSDLIAIVIRHKDGIIYTMNLTKMAKTEDPGIDFFRFNQADYPNVDVIELMD